MDSRPWVAIQRNPRSGSGSRRRALFDLCRRLREHGFRPRVFSRREALQERLQRGDRRATLRCLVAAGGDGTVGDVINRYPDVPIAVLPLGTENLLARHIGVSRCGSALADVIAAGHTRRFDACVLRSRSLESGEAPLERRFLIMASIGVDADVIHRLDARRAGNITHWSYLPVMGEAFRRYDFPELKVFVDDAAAPLAGCLAVVANLPMYALKLPIAASARGDDGLLDVRVFERPSVFQLLRYCYHVVRRGHERLPDVHVRTARRVRVESSRPAPLQIDGDPAGWTPAEITVQPAAVEVFVPPPWDFH